MPQPPSSGSQAGRLSLPACEEEVAQGGRASEGRSLSASQAAESQVIAKVSSAIWTSVEGAFRDIKA